MGRGNQPLEWYREVYLKDRYRCVYCGRDMLSDFDSWMSLEIDHLIPVSKGGDDSLDNRVATCHVCNRLKGQSVPEGYETMSRDQLMVALRQMVLQRRAEWQARFRPAVDQYLAALSHSGANTATE